MQQVRSLLSRREFLRTSGAVTVALAGSRYAPELPQTRNEPHTDPMLDLDSLAQFVDPLPIPSVLQPAEHRPSPANPRIQIPFYRLVMQQIQHQLHRDLKPVKHWSFGQSFPNPTFETRSGEALLVEWVNQLPNEHFLPIDHAIHGAEKDKPDICTERRRRLKATGTLKTGMSLANRPPCFIRTTRTRPCSGITTIRWVLTV